MKRYFTFVVILFIAIGFVGCKNYATNKLKREMKAFAKSYLKTERVVGYDSLTVDSVDTLTEMSYAQLNIIMLNEMAADYQNQYDEAAKQDRGQKLEYLSLYINEIERNLEDFENMLESGELKDSGVLLFWVTGHYVKDNERKDFYFFVSPDKKKLYTLDPFNDNLLYKDE